jgi:hypothetical protein
MRNSGFNDLMNTQDLMKNFIRKSRENPLRSSQIRASKEMSAIVRKSKSRNAMNRGASVLSGKSNNNSQSSKFTKLGTRRIKVDYTKLNNLKIRMSDGYQRNFSQIHKSTTNNTKPVLDLN